MKHVYYFLQQIRLTITDYYELLWSNKETHGLIIGPNGSLSYRNNNISLVLSFVVSYSHYSYHFMWIARCCPQRERERVKTNAS